MDETPRGFTPFIDEADQQAARALIGAARAYDDRLRASLDEQGSFRLVVPEDFLPRLKRIAGYELIRADVEQPMIAVPLDVVL